MQFIESLPVSQHLPEISLQLNKHKRLVLTAEPGAGKSTAVPLFLLQQDWLKNKKIIMLEPRRVAAKAIAHFLAGQLGETPGQTVGYRVKNESKVSEKTRLEIVTEGILTRQLQQDPELSSTALIIFDEFHERSLQADLGLMLVKEVMNGLREDLHCLVMSATIDSDLLSQYLDDAPVLHCEGRAYPVAVSYHPPGRERLAETVWNATKAFIAGNVSSQKHEDILVFLPGQADILRCIALFSDKLGEQQYALLPLYASLPLAQQQRALKADPNGRQRILFATNIAETSLTIDGVGVVIDSGLERRMLYDAKTGMSRLETGYIAKASATQRSGRAGRTAPGSAVRLWSETQQQQLPDYRTEEIKCADLMDLILQLAVWGQHDFLQIDWLTPPPETHYERSKTLLRLLGLFDSNDRLTDKGRQAVQLSLSPRHAALFFAAQSDNQKCIAADICALLQEQDLLRNFHTVSFQHRLQALWKPQDYKSHIKQNVLNQVRSTAQKILARAGVKQSYDKAKLEQRDDIGKLLLAGYPDLLAQQRKGSQAHYLMFNGRGAELSEDDPLNSAKWLTVLDIDAQLKSGRIWLAAEISEQDVTEFTQQHREYTESVFWNEKAGKAQLLAVEKFGAIELTRKVSEDLTLEQRQRLLLQQVHQKGLKSLNWTAACQRWLDRVCWLSSVDTDFPECSEQLLLTTLDSWLAPYLGKIESHADLQKLDVYSLSKATLDWQWQTYLDEQAPEVFVTPTGEKFVIHYDVAQGPMISVRLQSLFGLTESPKLANQKVPLKFELLSPARRAIQTTSDLYGFWTGSYHEVAKEMRGRYPKHRWPEAPLLEKPGHSLKQKR